MKIVINSSYNYLEDFIKNLPNDFNDIGNTIQERRNVIKVVDIDGIKLNVKRFKKPILLNRFVYSFVRKPKAYKAYYNALKVLEKGFQTPTPIAYIEEKENGLLSTSYFISTQLENVREIRDYYFSQCDDSDSNILSTFALFTAQLHEADILHLDYSPGNILYSKIEDTYEFSLVDINRMSFEKVSIEKGCLNFCRLFEYDAAAIFIAKEYAKARKTDEKLCIDLILKYKHQFEAKKARKKRLKEVIGK